MRQINHVFQYTVLATAVMVLVHWFKDDIHAGAVAIGNATANALGAPLYNLGMALSSQTWRLTAG